MMAETLMTMDQILNGIAELRVLLMSGILERSYADKEEVLRQAIIKLSTCPDYPLGPEDCLTKEEVLKRDNKPVWVHVLDHSRFADPRDDFDGWGMVDVAWVRMWSPCSAEPVHVNFHIKDYGTEWVAYDHEPGNT